MASIAAPLSRRANARSRWFCFTAKCRAVRSCYGNREISWILNRTEHKLIWCTISWAFTAAPLPRRVSDTSSCPPSAAKRRAVWPCCRGQALILKSICKRTAICAWKYQHTSSAASTASTLPRRSSTRSWRRWIYHCHMQSSYSYRVVEALGRGDRRLLLCAEQYHRPAHMK